LLDASLSGMVMRVRPRLLLFAACSLAVRRTHAAEAIPKTARLVYTRADVSGCPDEETMKNTVSARLGYDPFKPDPEHIVTAAITREGKGLRGHVELRDRAFTVKGTRSLASNEDDCAELASSLALAISIAIDPLSANRTAPLPPPVSTPPAHVAPPAAGGPAAAAAPLAAVAPTEEAPRREHGQATALRMGTDASVSFGATPGTSFAPALFAGVGFARLSLDVEGTAHLAASANAASGGSVSASLLLASFAPCFHGGTVVGCALLGVGRLSGAGGGVDEPASGASTYANAGGRVGAEVPLSGRFSLRIHGDLLFPLVSTKLRLRGVEVWGTPPVTAALGAGILAHFP